jgi:hypothetical protein
MNIVSRSYKKPIIKDRGALKGYGSKVLRKRVKAALKAEHDVMPMRNECVNQYDECDFIFDLRRSKNKEDKNRAKRK